LDFGYDLSCALQEGIRRAVRATEATKGRTADDWRVKTRRCRIDGTSSIISVNKPDNGMGVHNMGAWAWTGVRGFLLLVPRLWRTRGVCVGA
jgi:hypothetical protein